MTGQNTCSCQNAFLLQAKKAQNDKLNVVDCFSYPKKQKKGLKMHHESLFQDDMEHHCFCDILCWGKDIFQFKSDFYRRTTHPQVQLDWGSNLWPTEHAKHFMLLRSIRPHSHQWLEPIMKYMISPLHRDNPTTMHRQVGSLTWLCSGECTAQKSQ